jgi:hypothetical protein
MHLPYMRRAGPEVLATARAQHWDPAEVVKALRSEEVVGRERSAFATRRIQAAFWMPSSGYLPPTACARLSDALERRLVADLFPCQL